MRSPLAWLAVATICASVLGCTGTNSTPLTPGSPPNGGNGGSVPNNQTYSMRVLNASPDFGPIDVYVDGNRVWQNVKYGTWGVTASILNAPFYVSNFQPASHNIAVYAAGAGAGQGSQQASVTTFRDLESHDDRRRRQGLRQLDHSGARLARVHRAQLEHAAADRQRRDPSRRAQLAAGRHLLRQPVSGAEGQPVRRSYLPRHADVAEPRDAGQHDDRDREGPGRQQQRRPDRLLRGALGTQNCITPLAYINPGSANPVGVTLPGGVVYPSPPPPQPGTSPAPPYDTNSTIPPSSSSYTPLQLQTFAPNTLSVYIVDGPPLPGTTVPVPVMIGTFDPNFLN